MEHQQNPVIPESYAAVSQQIQKITFVWSLLIFVKAVNETKIIWSCEIQGEFLHVILSLRNVLLTDNRLPSLLIIVFLCKIFFMCHQFFVNEKSLFIFTQLFEENCLYVTSGVW